jgi:hypothetical protein
LQTLPEYANDVALTEGMLSKLSLLPASAGFLFEVLFNPDDGGDPFLKNVRLSPNYVALQPRRL